MAVPHELRITQAMLYDFIDEEPVGAVEHNVDRASLYASAQVTPDSDIQAYVGTRRWLRSTPRPKTNVARGSR